jgi:hypothetical protein
MRVGQVRGVESGPLLVMLKNLGFVLLQLAQNSCVVAVFSEPVSDGFVHLRELRNLIF